VGNIIKHRSESTHFRVDSVENLTVILSHFNKYPLITLSILFNRIVIVSLQYSIILHILSLFMCNKGISLHGGLLHITNITQIFQIFIVL